jgi:hypothetical protein
MPGCAIGASDALYNNEFFEVVEYDMLNYRNAASTPAMEDGPWSLSITGKLF